MHRAMRRGLHFTFAVLLALLSLGPAAAIGPESAEAAASTTVIYNLYATDGYVRLADNTDQYIYGFVGGRKTSPPTQLKYLTSSAGTNPAGLAPVTLQTLALGAPDPTGGPVSPTSDEYKLIGHAQFPAPIIYATTNDVVEIRLKNLGVANVDAPNDPHSIHLHGLDVDAANDGVPETSVGAIPGYTPNATEQPLDPGAGNVVVYMFAPSHPGTYMYHCHQEASIHVQMGMYGGLVVYNPKDAAAATGPGMGRGGTLFNWRYDKDYVMLLTEFDIGQHVAEATALAEVPVEYSGWDYRPQYWFINGLSFPQTVHVNNQGFVWNEWLQAHPGYDPFITGSVGAKSKVLVRMINLGFETQPMHVHGFHFKVLGSDARAWTWGYPGGPNSPFGTGLEKNTITVGSGETYELLFDFGQQSTARPKYAPNATDGQTGAPLISSFPGGTQTRYSGGSPVSNTNLGAAGIVFGGSDAYITGPEVTGSLLGPDNGQYFPFHNHDDYKATNAGAYPGGMFTMIRTDP